MYKKILLILSVLLLTGCQSMTIEDKEYTNLIKGTLNQENLLYNRLERGYRFYLPRNFNVEKSRYNNHVLVNEGTKYYLNIGLIPFYNEKPEKYVKNKNAYYAEEFTYNNKYGYLELINKDSYFYVKMMYNYSRIEAKVKKDKLNETIVNCGIILSSVTYNRSVIDDMGKEELDSYGQKMFELEGPKDHTSETYLDYIDRHDKNNKREIKDPDVIN